MGNYYDGYGDPDYPSGPILQPDSFVDPSVGGVPDTVAYGGPLWKEAVGYGQGGGGMGYTDAKQQGTASHGQGGAGGSTQVAYGGAGSSGGKGVANSFMDSFYNKPDWVIMGASFPAKDASSFPAKDASGKPRVLKMVLASKHLIDGEMDMDYPEPMSIDVGGIIASSYGGQPQVTLKLRLADYKGLMVKEGDYASALSALFKDGWTLVDEAPLSQEDIAAAAELDGETTEAGLPDMGLPEDEDDLEWSPVAINYDLADPEAQA